MLCVLISYKFKVDSERQIFWETFHGIFILLSEFLPEICWEKIAEEILFVFWGSNPGFTSNKPTHYLLDYGDFNFYLQFYITLGSSAGGSGDCPAITEKPWRNTNPCGKWTFSKDKILQLSWSRPSLEIDYMRIYAVLFIISRNTIIL